jgi:RNA polymerase sigma-70 factor (ECF subfamily)
MGDESDGVLVERAKSGEKPAFDELVRRHQSRIYSLVRRFVPDPDEALDLSQETFVRAYTRLHSFRGRAAFSTWLYRIAVNICLNHLRHHKLAALPEWSSDPAGEVEDPAQAVGRRQIGEAIRRAVAELSPKQKTVFVLRHFEGLTFAEIGKVTSRTTGSAKANHFQALAKLRKALRAYL